MTTLRELVTERAESSPHRCFLADARSERSFDFAMLRAAADAWRRELDAAGVPPGARVLVDVDDPLAFCAVHLAVIAAGRCSTPVDPAAPAAQAHRTRRALRPWLVVSDRAAIGGMRVNPASGMPAHPAAPVRAGLCGEAAHRYRGPARSRCSPPDRPARPRRVVLTERQLLHVARSVVGHHELSADGPWFQPTAAVPHQRPGRRSCSPRSSPVARWCSTGGSIARGSGSSWCEHEITWVNAVPAILSILALDNAPAVPATACGSSGRRRRRCRQRPASNWPGAQRGHRGGELRHDRGGQPDHRHPAARWPPAGIGRPAGRGGAGGRRAGRAAVCPGCAWAGSVSAARA